MNPDIYYVLGVKAEGGVCHSVVACGDEVVHDPSFEVDLDTYAPMDDKGWWVTYLVPRAMRRL